LIAAGAAFGTRAAMARTTDATLPKLGIQLYSLRGYKREEALQHAKDLGFEQVEFYSGMLAMKKSPPQRSNWRVWD
jgi:phosphosulfolactate synthase (CoM biosynthesis protein A)